MNAATWVAVIVPIVGLVGTIITVLAARRQDRASATKTSADALQVIQDTTLSLLDPLKRRVEQVEAENTYLRADIEQMRSELGMVRDDRDVLVAAIKVHVAWEDKGRPDPPGAPTIGARVRAVLERLHAA